MRLKGQLARERSEYPSSDQEPKKPVAIAGHAEAQLPQSQATTNPSRETRDNSLKITFRGEKLIYKSVAKEISKPPFLAPEVQWA